MVSLSNHERTALRQACLELAERLRVNGSRTHRFYLFELLVVQLGCLDEYKLSIRHCHENSPWKYGSLSLEG